MINFAIKSGIRLFFEKLDAAAADDDTLVASLIHEEASIPDAQDKLEKCKLERWTDWGLVR